MEISIRQASEDDIPALYKIYEALDKKDDGFFESCFEKDCLILIASTDKTDVGFGILNFEPKYRLYQKLEIPEVQDLNVLPDYREQGIGTQLIDAFETIAADQGAEQIGISVGLTADYGPAQRLYAKLGYIPDGQGVTYDRDAVAKGISCEMDDDLALMMMKSLIR